MRMVFMGTPDFAVPCLKAMLMDKYDIVGVVTQPDRAKGRGKNLASPPVKVLAEKAGIPIYQPERIRSGEFIQKLKGLDPDIIVVVAFGQILPQEILRMPSFGCVNIHASLLPKYRGAAPINWCIINGESRTGITSMYMDEGLDTGDMIIQKEIGVGENETAGELHDRMSELGASVLSDTIKLIAEGRAGRIPQNNSEATYAPIMSKALGKIDWSKDAGDIRDLIRGTQPWPGAYSSYKGKAFKVFRAAVMEDTAENSDYGIVRQADSEGIVVSCGSGNLRIEELQFENENRMSVGAYLRGHSIDENVRLE